MEYLDTFAYVLMYTAPAIVAFERKHHNKWAIGALNVLLGWTIIGWIIGLIWSMTAVRKEGGAA